MFNYRLALLCCIFFLSASVVAFAQSATTDAQIYKFPTKKQANDFISKEKASGRQTELDVQKQEKQRYTVLLSKYNQWGNAFKQAQRLEKQGFADIEVVKGRYDRGYSIIVQQSLNKKKAGKTFNKLRSLGLRNVKVKTDKIKLVSYLVSVYKTVPGKLPDAERMDDTSPGLKKPQIATKTKPAGHVQEKTATSQDDEIKLGDDTIILVMSDSSDITYEISLEESEDAGGKDFEWAIDKVVLEQELFTRSASTVDHVQYLHGSGHAKWNLSSHWELQLAARIDGNYQHGDSVSDNDELDFDYGDSYLLFRDQSMKLTFGADTIRWGKVDIFAPTDTVATLDLTRGVLYEWGEGYRATPVVRGEFFFKDSKLDIVYLPYFREAELPDEENVWHPVNVNEGRILGFEPSPLLKILLQNGKIDDDISATDGGFAIRYSDSIDSIDYDLTIQKVKLSAPYYQVNPLIVADPSLLSQEKYSLIERHPRTWVIGGDVEFQMESALFRIEAAWFSDLPATTATFQYETYEGFKWATGTEFYPGDGDTRVNLQLSGSHIDEKEKILDRDNMVTLNGEIESLFDNNRWKLGGRFSIGLDEKDIYISPEVAYLGWEPFELYSAIHYLEGDDNTVGGFYKLNTMLTIGWRGQF